MRISDWSSDVCSSDLQTHVQAAVFSRCPVHVESQGAYHARVARRWHIGVAMQRPLHHGTAQAGQTAGEAHRHPRQLIRPSGRGTDRHLMRPDDKIVIGLNKLRSEEHTSELQSLKRISSAGLCLKKKTKHSA